jgi:hypothetical protein
MSKVACCCLSLTRGHDVAVPTLRAASFFKKMPNQKGIKAESKPNQKAQHQLKISDATPIILVYYFGNR